MTTKDKIRNCLNIIAMCFKIAESSLRMLNK